MAADESSVRVALRIRPQISRELIEGSKTCTRVADGIPQVWIGNDHAYTYDHVFDTGASQESVFEIVNDLVDGCLDGYNATILAYGQTGSGKTFTMGTGFDVGSRHSSKISSTQGIIPRAVHRIFDNIQSRREAAQANGEAVPEFKVSAQFVELYNEEVFDLTDSEGGMSKPVPTMNLVASPAVTPQSSSHNLSISETPPNSSDPGPDTPKVKGKSANSKNYASSFPMVPPPAERARFGFKSFPTPTPTPTPTPNTEAKTAPNPSPLLMASRKGVNSGGVQIREDATGGIYLVGVGSKPVLSAKEAMECLYNGALSRTTASTNMNDESSRSHAIFTLHVKQQRMVSVKEEQMDTGAITDCETLTAKFHFVDLAGSERLKRTGAVGDRAKESISINGGLLALGNVISALGDKSKKASHVPYRDSKLTRLLQDSLGGNSRTMMIACVSPSERDFLETLNTLKYANRAKNIKNKVTINQDKNSTIISHLRAQIQQLEVELLEYKQGKRILTSSGEETESDMYRENILLQSEITNLTSRIKALQGTIDCLTVKNSQLLTEKATGTWILSDNTNCDLTSMVQKYIQEIEELGAKLVESENTCGQLRKKIDSRLSGGPNLNNSLSPRHPIVPMSSGSIFSGAEIVEPNLASLLEDAKNEIKKERVQVRRLQSKESSRRRARNPADDLMDEDFSSSGEEGDENENDASDLETDDGSDSNVNAELAQLTNEIGTKQRLIDQLELSQKRILGMKEHYEEKLTCLTNRIKITQEERDKVLSKMNSQVTPQGQLKQVKEDYEKKLVGMQTELKKWQSAHKEHQKNLRNQVQHERQIQVLRAEVDNMKRIKVKLMNQVKEENARRREIEFQRNKEIAQLKKVERQKDNFIRTLETENKKREIVLKRKHEEVNALKKINRNVMSKKAAGHLLGKSGKKFSPIKAKRKWTALREGLIKSSSNKETIENLEKEMLADISSRTALSSERQDLLQELNDTLFKPTPDRITYINDQIDTLTINIRFLDEKVADNQRSMLELTSANEDETVTPGMSSIIAELNKDECGYLLEKMYQQSLDVLINSGHQTKLNGILQQDNIRMNRDLDIAKDLLFYLYSKVEDLDPERILQLESLKSEYQRNENGFREDGGLGAPSKGRVLNQTFVAEPKRNGCLDVMRPIQNYEQPKVTPGTLKARRLTATPNELLGDSTKRNNYDQALANFPEESENVFVNPNDIPHLGGLNRVNSVRSSARLQRRGTYTIPESTPSIPPIVDIKTENNEPQPSTANIQRNFSISRRTFSKGSSNNSTTANNGANNNGQASSQTQTTLTTTTYAAGPTNAKLDETFLNSPTNTPPGSPVSSRKAQSQQRDDNVFQRLTSSTTNTGELLSSNGVIRPVRDKSGGLQKGAFSQTHVAIGHSKSVLSLCATDETLYTGSKDGTLKIWDLNTGVELRTLTGHQLSVNCVRYDPTIRCIFSVSSYFIKAWDTRMRNSICLNTLLSSGITSSGALQLDPNYHVNHLPVGECNIYDIAITTFGGLYSTCVEKVRVWDLRVSRSIGFLGGKHQAQIMCMATDNLGDEKELLCTGSKDHCIKVYDFDRIEPSRTISVPPKTTLDPPHYDGIEALALSGSTLFSGSRDTCIKKWDLTKQEPLVESVNKSHLGWITGLTFAPGNDDQLISTSRDGVMKLWSVDTCAQLGIARVNKNGINCVTRNSSHIFTGYSEGNVGFWRVSKSNQGDFPTVNVKSEVFTADELDQL